MCFSQYRRLTNTRAVLAYVTPTVHKMPLTMERFRGRAWQRHCWQPSQDQCGQGMAVESNCHDSSKGPSSRTGEMVGARTPAFPAPLISGSGEPCAAHRQCSQGLQSSERADHTHSNATSSSWKDTPWSFLLISQAVPVTLK